MKYHYTRVKMTKIKTDHWKSITFLFSNHFFQKYYFWKLFLDQIEVSSHFLTAAILSVLKVKIKFSIISHLNCIILCSSVEEFRMSQVYSSFLTPVFPYPVLYPIETSWLVSPLIWPAQDFHWSQVPSA